VQFPQDVYRNNADLGKGVPRPHVFHDAWELLFFIFSALPRERICGYPFLSLPPFNDHPLYRDMHLGSKGDLFALAAPTHWWGVLEAD
jgi:hypothetical protein